MAQINIRMTSTFQTPAEGCKGYGFNASGIPVMIDETGTSHPLAEVINGFSNIIADLGIGIEADLPGTAAVGQVYVTTDSLKKYTRVDEVSWNVLDLVRGQYVQTEYELWVFTGTSLLPLVGPHVPYLQLEGGITIRYNAALDVVEIEYANGTVLQVGREQVSFVYNDTESTIVNGTPVYYSGVGGSGVQMPAIAEADASNLATAMVKGHTTIDIPANSYGIIVCKGEMTVESHGLTVGSKIYLGVGGGYVNTPPSNPNLTIELGIVLDANTLHVYPCIISPFTNSSTSLTSVLFLSNVDSGISTFKNLSKTLDAAETTKTITATNNTVAGEKYISEPLGITTIPAAVFAARSICKVSSTLGTSKIRFDVSLYHEDTTTTLLFSDESDDINFTVDTVIEFSVPFTAITCLATDRLLIELYFTATHTNPITLTYYVGDGRATYVTLPLPISHTDLSNLNSDDNFLHVTSGQITGWNNKVDSPASSVNNTVPVFDGVTGKLLKGNTGVSIVSGNVGIGTNNPSEKLDVDGNIAVSGTVDGRDVSVDGAKLDTTVVGPASAVNNSIPVFDGVTGKLLKDDTKVSIVSGDVVGSNTAFRIKTDTVDGADNKILQISSAGGSHESRGGYIELIGNEYATFGGNINIVAGAGIQGKIGLYTGSSERIRVASDGNVGINTTLPEAKLHIQTSALGTTSGDYQIISKLHVATSTNQYKINEAFVRNANGNDWLTTRNRNFISIDSSFATPGTGLVWWDRFPNILTHSFGSGATTYMTMNPTGIGIGNTSPTYKLDVNTATGNSVIRSKTTQVGTQAQLLLDGYVTSDAQIGNIVFYNNGDSLASIVAERIGNNDAGELFFGTQPTGSIFISERIRIKSTGEVNIGDGTVVPYSSAKLTLQGGDAINLVIGGDSTSAQSLTNNTVKYGRIGSRHYANAEEPVGMLMLDSNQTVSDLKLGGGTGLMNAATQITFFTASNTTTTFGTERMRIDNAGNVGIGTNNPSEKLHVIGNIAVSGTVDGRDVSVDGAKLDDSVDVSSGVVYKKFAKTLNITSTSNTVVLFTIPSSKIAFMGFNEPKIVIHSYGTLATNDAVIRLKYRGHSGGGGEITQDISLDKMSAAPYYNVLEIAALPKIMGPGAVTMSVITAGTSGTVLIKGEVTW